MSVKTEGLKTFCLLAMALSMINYPSLAGAESAYSKHQDREIKALSAEQITQLQEGAGMGFALSAELNGYPGPKHVLELKNELGLSSEQEQATMVLFNAMQQAAQQLGLDLINNERQLEALFQNGHATERAIQGQVDAIGLIRSKLRGVHLVAHLKQFDLLTAKQNQTYQVLRGYHTNQHSQHHGALN